MSNSLPEEEGSGQELFQEAGAVCAKALSFSVHST